MIELLKLINFRNFEEKIMEDFEIENFIIWENGKWKTNILEALSQIWNNSLLKLDLDNLIKIWKDYFFIEVRDEVNTYSFHYSKNDKKKSFLVNNKKTTSKNFFLKTYSCVIFSPISMNMVYLSPSLRRDFLDDTLKSSFPIYWNLLKNYKKILKSRNLTLKAINEWKASKSEIQFWDKKFIEIAKNIYEYRLQLIDFLQKMILEASMFFSWKIKIITLEYVTKISKNDIENSIKTYLETNFERDIILQKTHIWPHIDDFIIKADDINIVEYASRWEIKSIMIYLKFLEWIFIEQKSGKKPILIIDDLISELDWVHKELLIKKIEYYQAFISSIYDNTENNKENYHKFILS
jgi:DNA replication and repair protein RecF